jgi:hypothetical protein
MVEHCLYNKIQFTQTHLIVSLKITMLNMVEQCFLKVSLFIPTHLIAISQIIEQIFGVAQCI